MIYQVGTHVKFAQSPQQVMDFISTPDFYPLWYNGDSGRTYKVEGVTDRPLREGDKVREYWRMPPDAWTVPEGCSTLDGNDVLIAVEWTCAQRIDPFVYRIEGRYLEGGTGEPVGEMFQSVNYFAAASEGGGTNLMRLWNLDTTPSSALTRGYVDALTVARGVLEKPEREVLR